MRQLSANEDLSSVTQEKDWSLVYFSAGWCGPCKTMAPVMEQISTNYQESVTTIKVDVDKTPQLAGRYNIRGVPTLLLFNGNEIVDSRVGSMSTKMVSDWINENRS